MPDDSRAAAGRGQTRRRGTPRLTTGRLVLDPLRVEDADELAEVLSDPALYTVIGGGPPDADRLRDRFSRMLAGPDDPDEQWHNWTVRLRADGTVDGTGILTDGSGPAVGTAQATVVRPGGGDGTADLAWVTGTPWQGRGYAREAAAAVADRLLADGVTRLRAHVQPGHTPSEKVAARIGLSPTGRLDDEGEQLWELSVG